MSSDVIMKVGGKYNASNYWTGRQSVSDYLKLKLNEELNKAYATCEDLQIIRIDLPDTFENSIVLTQIEVQKTNMRKFEQEAELIRQDIGVMVSQAQQDIRVTNATAQAEATKIKNYAKAQALQKTIDTEAAVFANVKNKIGLSELEFNEYTYLTGLAETKANILVGLQNSIINLSGGNTPVTNNQWQLLY